MAVLSLIISQFQLESNLIRQKLWPEIHLTGFLTKCLKKDKVDKKWLPYCLIHVGMQLGFFQG
jgi:hypothetical protein